MRDVAADRDVEPVQAALGAADGERVEQRLGRVLVAAVAGIEHGAVDLLGQQVDGAGMRVAHHQQVGVHGVQRQRGVDQGLALLDRAGLHRHVHHVRTKALAGDLEARLRAGGVLEEHVDLGQAGEHVGVLLAPPRQGHVLFRKV